MYNIDNVFGIQRRGDISHYVQRTQVDDEFIRNLARDKHLCVYGSSKQGKTALRKKHISPSQEIVIVCDPDWTSNDIFAAVLKAAGCVIETGLSISEKGKTGGTGGAEATVKVPLFGEIKGKAGLSAESERSSDKKFENLPINLGDIADVLKILGRTFQGSYVVVEEFHYLPDKVQRDFALKLKAVHELSKYTFIIVGVWLEKNRMAHLNPDLAGRVAAINADEWMDSDLLKVIDEGETKLNIRFPAGFPQDLVQKACGSIFLVREACYRACEANGIFNSLVERRELERLSAPALLANINLGGVDYPSQLMGLLGLEGIEQTEQEREEDLKGWVVRGLTYATAKDLREGLGLNRVRSLIRQHHPYKYQPSVGQIGKILQALQSAQNIKTGHSLFDYDRQEKIVRCVDKGFILWRTNQKLEKIKDMLFEA
jgi:hypothetical protein